MAGERKRKVEGKEEAKYIIARLTSPIGITPSFSPFFSSAKRAKASLISFSSSLVMLCSFASLDCRAFGVAASAARRLAGWIGMLEPHFEREGVEELAIMRDSFNKGYGGDKVNDAELPSDEADGLK
jgi:hypothetical protein